MYTNTQWVQHIPVTNSEVNKRKNPQNSKKTKKNPKYKPFLVKMLTHPSKYYCFYQDNNGKTQLENRQPIEIFSSKTPEPPLYCIFVWLHFKYTSYFIKMHVLYLEVVSHIKQEMLFEYCERSDIHLYLVIVK